MTSTTATDLYWEKLADYLGYACSLFGLPEQLAQKLWLTRDQHKLFTSFIRPLEELVRRLIFIAALELAPMTLPPAPERKFREARGFPANVGATFDPAKPETWRVNFKLHLDRRRPRRQTPALAGGDAGGPYAPSRISSAPSAQRLQALIHVFSNRDKLAAALARNIARNTRAAHAYITRPAAKLAHKPVYITLFDLIPHAQEAYQRFIMRKLETARPDSS